MGMWYNEEKEPLGDLLERISGTPNIYFVPPGHMKYPCVKYDLAGIDVDYADNKKYRNMEKWKLTVISEEPDEIIVKRLLELPYCKFDRSYIADSMNHFVLELYY